MLRRRRPRRIERRRLGALLLRTALLGCAVFLLTSVAAVVGLRWFDPPTSAFILQHRVSGLLSGEARPWAYQEWVSWQAISPHARIAVVAAEDQRFPMHSGFDVEAIRTAIKERQTKGRMRGASTISQQVAKNLFLWPGRSWVRKGLEAYFTVLIELFWPKRRTLEVYLNVAQFGEKTFGVGAASTRFFGKPASRLTAREASLLAAVLPNPVRMQVRAPSPYVRERAAWIRQQARQLGPDYLQAL